jgi:dipeptidyl aminopeptidase/acylaminoacyl peptidase
MVPGADEPHTLRALADVDLGATTLERGAVIAETADYTTTAVTYASDGTTASGSLSVPTDDGPHPGLVLVHGVVNPAIYLAGSGMQREQAYFSQLGYVVLTLDLRNSTAAPTSAAALGVDLGSTIDVINGIRALRAAGLAGLDGSRIGLLGHSLGGLLALNTMVARPELVDAAVALSPASIDPDENVDYLTAVFGGTPAPIIQQYGTPEDNPKFWRDISPGTLVDRVQAPLLIIHGTADEITPFRWSEETVAVWEAAGKDVDLVALEGEGHVFQGRWSEAMALAGRFLDDNLTENRK